MDERYLLATVWYVERNPVADSLCRYPGGWYWSSAAAHFTGKDDDLVVVKPMLDRISDWTAYLGANDDAADETALIKRHTKTGGPLGDRAFVRRLEMLVGRPLEPLKSGQARLLDHGTPGQGPWRARRLFLYPRQHPG